MTPVNANETKLAQLQRFENRVAPVGRHRVSGVVSLMAAECLSPSTFALAGKTATFTELKSWAVDTLFARPPFASPHPIYSGTARLRPNPNEVPS